MGVSFHTLTRSVTTRMVGDVSSQAVDAYREGLRERLQQLKAEAQKLERDWWESRAIRTRDEAFLQAAKRAQANGNGPLPYPGELDANAELS